MKTALTMLAALLLSGCSARAIPQEECAIPKPVCADVDWSCWQQHPPVAFTMSADCLVDVGGRKVRIENIGQLPL